MAFRRPGVRVPPAPLVPAFRGPLATVVGAHEFRDHFGCYRERAAAGEAVLVTRRGKPLFRLSPASAEVAAHPSDAGGKHEPYLLCDDVHAAGRQPEGNGVTLAKAVSDEGWGLVASIDLPGGGEFRLYEPRHPRP